LARSGSTSLTFRFPGGFAVARARQLMPGNLLGPGLITCRSGAGVYLADIDRQRRDARQWRHQRPLAGYGLNPGLPSAGSYICRVEVTIRAYDPRDAADLADVFFRSVRQVALSDYTTAQVRAWAPEPRTAEWAHREASDGRLVLMAANEDDRPVAYIDLEPNGHIDRVFCTPVAAGQGIASRLYDAVEAAARGTWARAACRSAEMGAAAPQNEPIGR
jgi:GNAT superfamily N-acetyltransferase